MPLSWRELRDLEYAGRRPDPFESLGFRMPPAAVLRRLARDYPDTVKIPDPLADTTTSTSASPFPRAPEAPLAAPLTPHPLSFFDDAYTIQKLQTEKCMYCTKVHGIAPCSYTRLVPKNAPVGPGCELVCRICESPFSGTCCGLDEGRAILKECIICRAYGDHWPRWCPRNNRVDKKLLDLPPDTVKIPDPLADTTTSTSASPFPRAPEAPLAAPLTPHPLSFFDDAYTIQKLQTEKCMYCTKVHGIAPCSYTRLVPKNAPVGPGCELVCRICESPFSGTCCGLDEGRAILKECIICRAYGDHWPRWCPRNNRVDKKLLDLPPGVFYVDFSRGASAPGKVEQKEPAKPASVKSNAVKDDDPEDDHDSDDEDDETPTPKKPGSKRRARASASAKTPVSAKKAKIDTDGEKGAHSDTPHPTEKGKTPPTDKQLQSPSFGSDGGLQSHNEDNDSAKM